MLSYGPNVLEDQKKMFLDILNTNGEVNIDWIREQKTRFDSIYNDTKELYDRFNRNKGKIIKLFTEENIPMPLYFDEYDLDDIKDLIYSQPISDELRKVNIHKLVNKLIVINQEISINIDRLDKIIKQVSNKKGLKNLDNLEVDTFDEHYYDLDAIREERGIVLDEPNKVVSSDTFYKVDEEIIDYTFDGTKTLKDIALEVFGAPKYWSNILFYDNNIDTLKKALDTRNLDIDKITSDPKYIKGITIKIPQEIVSYGDDLSRTQSIKTIKL